MPSRITPTRSLFRRLLPLPILVALILIASCGGGSSSAPTATPVGPQATNTSVASPVASPTSAATAVPTTVVPAKLGTYSGVAVTRKSPAFDALPGATAAYGTLGQAAYQIEKPANWNGELVLFAHGWVGFGTELEVQQPTFGLRQVLISEGFAWAASSFSENGYTPGIGADDTLALKRYFEQQYGKAKRTYLIGESMGGNAATLSLEYYPNEYDGAFAMCGALTGEEEIDFLLSWTALAEYTSGLKFPIGEGAAGMTQVLLTDLPAALGSPANPTQKGLQFNDAIRNLTGGARPFFVEGMQDQAVANLGLLLLDPNRETLLGRAGTNVGVTYRVDPSLGLDNTQLNASIRRFTADPAIRNAAAHPDMVPTTGKITKPLLTIHGTGDLFVPILAEISYHQKVAAAGAANLLVQRAIRSHGHCKFSPEEAKAGWDDLVKWVEQGVKPAGDDLTGNLTDIGKAFTNPLRAGDPGSR